LAHTHGLLPFRAGANLHHDIIGGISVNLRAYQQFAGIEYPFARHRLELLVLEVESPAIVRASEVVLFSRT
jgi:hypothetical protein